MHIFQNISYFQEHRNMHYDLSLAPWTHFGKRLFILSLIIFSNYIIFVALIFFPSLFKILLSNIGHRLIKQDALITKYSQKYGFILHLSKLWKFIENIGVTREYQIYLEIGISRYCLNEDDNMNTEILGQDQIL